MSDNEICRIVKRQLSSGAYYIAQRRVYKTKWFGEPELVWEDFVLVTNNCYGYAEFKKLRYCETYDPPPKELKDISYAEAACSEWVRINKPDEPVKVWSEE